LIKIAGGCSLRCGGGEADISPYLTHHIAGEDLQRMLIYYCLIVLEISCNVSFIGINKMCGPLFLMRYTIFAYRLSPLVEKGSKKLGFILLPPRHLLMERRTEGVRRWKDGIGVLM
jgi:hypothetical protein